MTTGGSLRADRPSSTPAHCRLAPHPPAELDLILPSVWSKCRAAGWRKDPRDRHASAGEFVASCAEPVGGRPLDRSARRGSDNDNPFAGLMRRFSKPGEPKQADNKASHKRLFIKPSRNLVRLTGAAPSRCQAGRTRARFILVAIVLI